MKVTIYGITVEVASTLNLVEMPKGVKKAQSDKIVQYLMDEGFIETKWVRVKLT